MSELIKTIDDKKLEYRCASGVGTKQMQDCVGELFKIEDIIQIETYNNDGELAVATNLIGDNGFIYSSMSPTIAKSVRDIMNIFGDHKVEVKIVSTLNPKSKRDFLQLEVL